VTTALRDPSAATGPARGASLIELMVGLVICLLISLAAAKSAELFGAIQRQGVASGGATTNTASALAAIKEDVAAGGMGFFANAAYRCPSLNLSVGNSVVANNAGFFPVQATRVGANDQLDVVYAQQVTAGAWTELKEVSNGSSAVLASRLPITVAQQPAILLARLNGALGSPCLVRTVTAAAGPDINLGTKQTLTFGVAGTHNQGVFTVTPDFQMRDPVIVLGNLNWNRYELQGTNLVITRRMNNTTATLLPNVIAFRVQYGVTNASTAIEDWVNSDDGAFTALNDLNAARVRAVRIGAVIRSPQREKADPTDNQCKAVPNDQDKVVLFKDTPMPVDIFPPGTDWKCYRYRTVEVVAPLRNLVAGKKPTAWPETPQ
jgi:type IV pilus assembly protein PilW